MALSDRLLKILLQFESDTSGLDKADSELDKTKDKLDEVGDSTKKAGDEAENLQGRFQLAFGIGAIAAAPFVLALNQAGEEIARLSEEQLALTNGIQETTNKYIQLARVAKDSGDVLKLGSKLADGLVEASSKFDEFRRRELTLWQTFQNSLTTIPFLSPRGLLAPALEAAQAASEQNLRTQIARFNGLISVANETAAAFDRIKTEPLAQGMAEVNTKVATLGAELAKFESEAVPPINATGEELKKAATAAQGFIDKSSQLHIWKELLQDLQKEAQKLQDALFNAAAAIKDVQSQIRSNLAAASGDTAGVLSERLSKLREDTFNQLFTGTNAVEAARLAEQLVDSERRKTEYLESQRADRTGARVDAEGEADARQDIVGFLSEESALLHSIRQSNELTQSDPFAFANQQQSSLINNLPQQIEAINQKIAEGQAKIANSALDPETYARASQGIEKLQFQAAQIGQRLAALTQPIRTSLVQWVNQFGSTINQVSNLITGTLTVAVNGVANAITSAIFKTQSWGQAFAQVAQSIIGNIIQIVVQWIAQQTIMLALNAIFGQTAKQTSGALAKESAAQWAPAATAASIASYGAASGFGLIAFIAALGAGTAAAVGLASTGGGFESGGFTGHGYGSQVAGIVHRGEYVMPKSTVDRAGGPAAFDRIRASINGSGGRDSAPHIYNFTDMEALQKAYRRDPSTKKFIVDTVNSAGGRLRT